jgi:hypothetical protein
LQGERQQVVRADRFRIGGHVVLERLVGVVADDADHFSQVVTLGQDADKFAVRVHHQEGADAVLDHSVEGQSELAVDGNRDRRADLDRSDAVLQDAHLDGVAADELTID